MRFPILASLVFALASSILYGQSAGLMPVPKAQFVDQNGHPYAGGKVYSFSSGTSTLLPTYQDSSGSVANSNPVILDSSGRANIWLSNSSVYRIQLQDSNGVVIWTVDGVTSSGTGGGGGSGVSSVFGRTGAVTAQGGDYTISQITNGVANNASNTYSGGTQNFGGAAHTIPTKVGTIATMPATCTVGELYFAIDASPGTNLYECTATNTWTAGSFLPLAGGTMSGSILVNPTDAIDLGSNSAELRKIYVKDISITGTCSGAGCGGAGSFLPTGGGTMTGNIASGPVGTLSLGSKPNPFGSVFSMTNVSSKKFEIDDQGATDLTGPFFSIQAIDGIALKQLLFYDDANNQVMTLTRVLGGVSVKKGQFDGDWNPMLDTTYNLGSNSSARWKDINFNGVLSQGGNTILDALHNATVQNLTILGTCSGCPGAGGGTFLPLAGGTMAGNILANAINTLSIGSKTTPFSGGYFMGNTSTKQLEIYDSTATDLNGIFFSQTASVNSFAKQWNLRDDSNATIFSIATVSGSFVNHQASLDASLSPATPNTRDLGNLQQWHNIFFGGSLIQNGTTRLDALGNATVQNLIVNGTCTGCGGGGSGVTSLSAASPIQVSGATGAVAISCPQCPTLNGNNSFIGSNSFGNSGLGVQTFNGSIAANFGLNMNGSNIINGGSVSANQFLIAGTTVIDGARNASFGGITASSAANFNGGINIPLGTQSTIVVGTFGNFYNRAFNGGGGPPSCGGVADGWMAYDTFADKLWVCNAGTARAH